MVGLRLKANTYTAVVCGFCYSSYFSLEAPAAHCKNSFICASSCVCMYVCMYVCVCVCVCFVLVAPSEVLGADCKHGVQLYVCSMSVMPAQCSALYLSLCLRRSSQCMHHTGCVVALLLLGMVSCPMKYTHQTGAVVLALFVLYQIADCVVAVFFCFFLDTQVYASDCRLCCHGVVVLGLDSALSVSGDHVTASKRPHCNGVTTASPHNVKHDNATRHQNQTRRNTQKRKTRQDSSNRTSFHRTENDTTTRSSRAGRMRTHLAL
jgi:hypothetical protein